MRNQTHLVILGLVALLAAVPAASGGPVTLDSLLREMIDPDAVARWPLPEFTCRQSSSYDRAKVAPDKPGWFANHDFSEFIREEHRNGRREQVMMDADGPGSIVRFWLTTTKNKSGTLRVYLDDKPSPDFVFPTYDLLSGNLRPGEPLAWHHPGYQPNGNGGSTLMLPIPYARHCKVTWEEASDGPRYYQIDYRTYPPGTAVQTVTPDIVEASRPLIDQVNKQLLSPPDFTCSQRPSVEDVIPAGQKVSLSLPAGPAAVRLLELKLSTDNPKDLEQALRSTILQIRFDDEDTVWSPISDFFGSGVGLNQLQSWYRTVNTDGTMICRWVMPYEKSARIIIFNDGNRPVTLSCLAGVDAWHWDDRSLYFHTTWHYEAALTTPPPRDWNYLSATGRGVYVGDTLALFNPVATWYGEGDEKIYVDGENFPSHMGTGTEDYYDFSFAPQGLMQTPFANQVRVDQSMTQGNNVLTRTRMLDAIPFQTSLTFDFELIAWRTTKLSYAATTYWYARPVAHSNIPPQPKEAALPVETLADAAPPAPPQHRPGAIEFEQLGVSAKSGDFYADTQDMEPFGAGQWSGGAQLLVVPQKIGHFVDVYVPAPDDRPRKLMLYATRAPDYGILRFYVNGKPVLTPFDGYFKTVQPSPPLALGVFSPRNHQYQIRIEVIGSNAAAIGAKLLFGLDCIVLEKP